MSANAFSSLCIPNKFCAYGFKQDNNILVTIHAATNGWAALGTGSVMDGSDMYVVLQKDNKCTVSRRKGSGYASPTPVSDQIASIVNDVPPEAAPKTAESWATLKCSFTRPIISDNSIADSKVPYIWAFGELSGGDIAEHNPSNKGSSTHNFLEAGQASTGSIGSAPFVSADPETYNLILFSHGMLFFLAWAVAPFIGIFIARYLKDMLGVWWYKLHLYIMLGVTGGFSLVSLILIVLYKQGAHIASMHEYIGVAVCSILLIQVIMGFVSNALWSPERTSIPWWDRAHWWLGRIVVIAANVNIYFGIIEFHERLGIKDSKSVLITFGTIVGLGVISMIIGQFIYGQVHHLNDSPDDEEESYRKQ